MESALVSFEHSTAEAVPSRAALLCTLVQDTPSLRVGVSLPFRPFSPPVLLFLISTSLPVPSTPILLCFRARSYCKPLRYSSSGIFPPQSSSPFPLPTLPPPPTFHPLPPPNARLRGAWEGSHPRGSVMRTCVQHAVHPHVNLHRLSTTTPTFCFHTHTHTTHTHNRRAPPPAHTTTLLEL